MLITWLKIGNVPEPLAIWTPVILAGLYLVYTALSEYDKQRAGKFQWFWQKFGIVFLAVLSSVIKKNDDSG